jgi:hypothetical protein
MKEGIVPIFEDDHNIDGGYWSLRITKKDSIEYWTKFIYYLCIDTIINDEKYEKYINGISVSPKINNCIFKIWNSNYDKIKTENIRNDLDFLNLDEIFYLQHNEN